MHRNLEMSDVTHLLGIYLHTLPTFSIGALKEKGLTFSSTVRINRVNGALFVDEDVFALVKASRRNR